LSSLHFQYTEQLDQMTANLLVADGIAAVVLSPDPAPVRVVGCRCVAVPRFADQMVWYASDHGLQLQLSQDLPDTLAAHLRQPVEAFLNDHNTSIANIDHWIVHPAGQILDASSSRSPCPGDVNLSARCAAFGTCLAHRVLHLKGLWPSGRWSGRGPGLRPV